jgi:hypothetical protein
MDTPSNITDTLNQADEDILTYTVSDEALEASAGTVRGPLSNIYFWSRCGGGPDCW